MELPEIKAVSNRNQFLPVQVLAELYASDQISKETLMAFAKRLLLDVQWAYRKATSSAIDQATALIFDPNYAERHKRQMSERRKRVAQKQADYKRRKLLETVDPEEIMRKKAWQLKYLSNLIDYHKSSLNKYTAERDALTAEQSIPCMLSGEVRMV